jgi:hypothetical protein
MHYATFSHGREDSTGEGIAAQTITEKREALDN